MSTTDLHLQRLTDQEIRHIFQTIDDWRGGDDGFVKAFAHAVTLAPRQTFLMMRPYLLLVIGKYNLGGYLKGFVPTAPENGRRSA